MMTSQVTSLGTIPPDSTFDLSLFSTLVGSGSCKPRNVNHDLIAAV